MTEMWRYVEGEGARIVPCPEQNLSDSFPRQPFDKTSLVAEHSRAPGEPIRIETTPAAGRR
jgi:hypothetical protein